MDRERDRSSQSAKVGRRPSCRQVESQSESERAKEGKKERRKEEKDIPT
jgi:hypothetical protein